MLVFIWFCVMTQAFAPGGQRIADAAVSSIQTHMREQVEGFAPSAATLAQRPSPRASRAR